MKFNHFEKSAHNTHLRHYFWRIQNMAAELCGILDFCSVLIKTKIVLRYGFSYCRMLEGHVLHINWYTGTVKIVCYAMKHAKIHYWLYDCSYFPINCSLTLATNRQPARTKHSDISN